MAASLKKDWAQTLMLLCIKLGIFFLIWSCWWRGGGGRGKEFLMWPLNITGKTHLNLLAEYILPDLVTKSSLHCQPPFFCGTLKCEEVEYFLTAQKRFLFSFLSPPQEVESGGTYTSEFDLTNSACDLAAWQICTSSHGGGRLGDTHFSLAPLRQNSYFSKRVEGCWLSLTEQWLNVYSCYVDYEISHLCLKKARRERRIVHCCMMCY